MTSSASTVPSRISPFSVFHNRNFSLLWTGQLISTMGSALTSLAASILVYRLTNSALSVGLMLMATAAPSLLVGLFAGVLVDRFDRKKIMLAADLLRAIFIFLIPFLAPLNIIWLYVIVMISSAIGQFFDPAQESVLPEVASEEELAAANSLMAISSFGSTAIGFALSGFIASAADISWAFYFDSFSFLFSCSCIFLTRLKPFSVEGETSVSVVLKNLKVGITKLFDTPVLRALFTVQLPVLIAFGMSNSLLLPFAMRALNANEFQYGLQEGLTSVGFVAASLLLAGFFDRMREGGWMTLSFLMMGLIGIVYSFTHSIPFAILLVTISGFFNAPSSIARRLVIQRNTPREARGRVNSVFFVSRDVLFLIGMGLAGLADFINIRIMYFSSAALILFGAILILILPPLRQDKSEWQRIFQLLKAAPTVAGVKPGRPAELSDLERLIMHLPSLSSLSMKEQNEFISGAQVVEATEGTSILRHGEISDKVYFVLDGRTVAGIATENGGYRSLSIMRAGDFFGEIAALKGVARTADVVAEELTTLLVVPAQTLHGLIDHPAIASLITAKMTERLNRTSINELPRFAGVDQKDAAEVRTVSQP